MKITGRIKFDKYITLEELNSLVEDVRGLAYPHEPDLRNYHLVFDIDTADFEGKSAGRHDLAVVTARALRERAGQLGVDFEDAAKLVKTAVEVASVWDEIVNIAGTYAYTDVAVIS